MAENTREAQTASKTEAETILLDSLLSETKLSPADGYPYSLVRSGTRKLLDELIRSESAAPKIDKELINEMIADIDRRLSAQVNELLHAEPVKQLESAWRGLKYLVDQIDFSENVRLIRALTTLWPFKPSQYFQPFLSNTNNTKWLTLSCLILTEQSLIQHLI